MFKPVRFVLTIAFLLLMVTHAAVNVGNAVYAAWNYSTILALNVLSISKFPLSFFTKLLKWRVVSFVLMYLVLLIYSLSYISSIYAFLLKSFKAT